MFLWLCQFGKIEELKGRTHIIYRLILIIIPCGIATTANDNYWMRSETDYKTYCIFRKNGNPGIIDEFHWIAIGY